MQNPPPIPEARVKIKPGFAWDGQDAYLFDIDGTLLRDPDRIHYNAFAAGIRQVMGFDVSLGGVSIHGNTDTGILLEACEIAGIPAELVEKNFAAICESMGKIVAEHRHQLQLLLMPGVIDVLAHLTRRGAQLGVATGNLEAIGWIKIEEAGLRKWFQFGGFSDHFPIRTELVANAMRKAKEHAGIKARVCVVGDTPRDIEAARANSLPVIAVATGNYSFETLLESHPDVCASSLAYLLAHKQVRK
jgi:phosphoglycolate phosphatase-like HAD superfamily hydrolase